MKIKQSLRPTLHKLNRQRYQNKIESARRLSDSINATVNDTMAFVFPAFIYKQLRREYR